MNDTLPNPTTTLAQADLVLLIATCLTPPRDLTDDMLVIESSEIRQLVQVAGAGSDHPIANCLTNAIEAASTTDRSVWFSEYTRLFSGNVMCPVNETAYIRRDKGTIIADICGFYNAFGFDRVEGSGEKPDHLLCELEFVGMLLVMLAHAQGAADDENVHITREALRAFLDDHVRDWLPLFAERLQQMTALPYYAALAEVLMELWPLLASSYELGEPQDIAEFATMLPDEEETPYECGMAEAEEAAHDGESKPVTLTGPPGSGLPQA